MRPNARQSDNNADFTETFVAFHNWVKSQVTILNFAVEEEICHHIHTLGNQKSLFQNQLWIKWNSTKFEERTWETLFE